MKPPAIESAVHTTPPIMSAATIPDEPLRPTATITTDARISVISVIPETGLEPTMAMAFAATVVKRNDITATSNTATRLCIQLPSITSNTKNASTMSNVNTEPKITTFIERSFSVRFTATVSFLPPNSREASPTALFIIPHDLNIPMIPAIAIPPIPILFAYSLKMTSGDI